MFGLALDAIINAHGESCLFKGDGSASISFNGVFDEVYVSMDPLSGEKISTSESSVLLRLNDIGGQPAHRSKWNIRGMNWVTKRVEPDGQGGARIFLYRDT